MSTTSRIAAALSLDSLGPDARAAFDLAADAGFAGIAIPTNHPQLAPADFGDSARRHFKKTLEHRHLSIDSIRIAAPRQGLADAATIDRTLANARAAITLAHALGVRTVSLYTGGLSNVPNPQATGALSSTNAALSMDTIAAATRLLASEADKAGITLALSSDSPTRLQELLNLLAAPHLRANLEPASLLAAGDDPVAIAAALGNRIGQFTAADAIKAGRQLRAVELDQGQVPLADLFLQLKAQHFMGPTVVDLRDLPNTPQAAYRAAEVLRRVM